MEIDSRVLLPTGTQLPGGERIRKLYLREEDWQIMLTENDEFALAATLDLRDRWVRDSLVGEQFFDEIDTCGEQVCVFVSKHGYLVSSIQHGPYPTNSIQARTFAISLRETRKILINTPLHDALYLEQITRLLPTYTQSGGYSDQTVLGTWLTAGVQIPTSSFQRLCELLKWMDPRQVGAILNEAGLPAGEGDALVKTQTRGDEEENKGKHTVQEKSLPPSEKLLPGSRFSLPGRSELETFFNENVVDILAQEEEYRRMGIEFPGAIVLHGPPGCGKTFAAERLVEFLNWPVYTISSASIGSPFIHDTSKKISEVFDKAINSAPSIVLIDEMEAFLTDRGAGQASGTHHLEEVAEFLRRIPEAGEKHVLVIAMTNMLNSIDPAILRRGRFDHIIEVKMPSAEEVHVLLSSLISTLPMADDVDLAALSRMLEGHPLSDVVFVVKESGRITVKMGKDLIDKESIGQAVLLLPKKKETKRIGF